MSVCQFLPDPEPLAYRVNTACAVLGVGRTTLYALNKTGAIRPLKLAGRTLIPRAEIDRLLSQCAEAQREAQ